MSGGAVLLLGAGGQLGQTLQDAWPALAGDSAPALQALDRARLDVTDGPALRQALESLAPALIINAAAYTRVDQAEAEASQAYQANQHAVREIALWAAANGARLLHVSTDFVFDGAAGRAYSPADKPNPLGVYGASKLAGEQAILAEHPAGSVIIRTGWLYSAWRVNFVTTMLRLMQERDHLRVVVDQVGTPTCTQGLAELIARIAGEPEARGIYHWSDAGVASWYDFAVAIQEEALTAGLLARSVPIEPIPSAQYPTAARRPAFSVLDKSATYRDFGCRPVHWRVRLRQVINQLANRHRS